MKKDRIYLILSSIVAVTSIALNIFLGITLENSRKENKLLEEKVTTAQNTLDEINDFARLLFSESHEGSKPQPSAIDILRFLKETEGNKADGYIFFEVGINKELQSKFIDEMKEQIDVKLYDFVSEEQAFTDYLATQESGSAVEKVLNEMQDKRLPSNYAFKYVSLEDQQSTTKQINELISNFISQNNLSQASITIQLR